ncbi:sulfotransferase domain-containing protein [Tsuneonella mangrovi]|uniref:sulfotransferase domain-containing protein n=1 Tax=Tsuneonella mangrovi TaxID=1982042 RepID=UPI000BA26C5D|nr:sulfotransferase domain-containing protein [Tsuneonella mangrovi]
MEAEAQHSGPPFIQPGIQQLIKWRDGDVVVSVPPKSGTTWTMNIVHQLLTGGTADFRDIYEEVPWIELLNYPGETFEQVASRVDAMPHGVRRGFKSHSAPPALPYLAAGSDPKVKYVVVFRNPEEAMVSFWPFMAKHSDEWFNLWGIPPGAMTRPDFPSFFADFIEPQLAQDTRFFGFLEAWWPLRNNDNVMFIHFADMKRDHEGSIRKIAKFLEVEPSEEQWPKILEYTSFAWMKAHEDKFEAIHAARVPVLSRGAMIRQGKAGKAKSDGMTDEIAQKVRAAGTAICSDPAALEWFYNGGECP